MICTSNGFFWFKFKLKVEIYYKFVHVEPAIKSGSCLRRRKQVRLATFLNDYDVIHLPAFQFSR